MVNNVDEVYSSLADPTRRAILIKIAQGNLNLQAVASEQHISLPAVSKHLKVLEQSELITRQKIGRQYQFTLTEAAKYWVRQLQNVEAFLKKQGKKRR